MWAQSHKWRNIFLASAALLAFAPCAFAAQPVVTLSTSLDHSPLQIGDTATITVKATVTGATVNDGITAFDIDLFPLFKNGIHFQSSPILNASAFVVSAGTPDAATGGLLGISGLFDPNGVGVNSEITLFTVQLQADAIGANSISAGLSVFPNGSGVPFQLHMSGDYVDPSSGNPVTFTVNSSTAIAPVTVTAVPEPSTGLIGGALFAAMLGKRRRRNYAHLDSQQV